VVPIAPDLRRTTEHERLLDPDAVLRLCHVARQANTLPGRRTALQVLGLTELCPGVVLLGALHGAATELLVEHEDVRFAQELAPEVAGRSSASHGVGTHCVGPDGTEFCVAECGQVLASLAVAIPGRAQCFRIVMRRSDVTRAMLRDYSLTSSTRFIVRLCRIVSTINPAVLMAGQTVLMQTSTITRIYSALAMRSIAENARAPTRANGSGTGWQCTP
jgi:hypothetical protein